MNIQEFILLGLLGLVAAAGFLDHSPAPIALIPDPLDVGGFPTLCASILVLCIALRIIFAVATKAKADDIPPLKPVILKSIVLMALYIVGFKYLGFYSATIIFTFVCLYVFMQDTRVTIKGAAMYTAITTLCWLVMFKGFNLYLPRGILF